MKRIPLLIIMMGLLLFSCDPRQSREEAMAKAIREMEANLSENSENPDSVQLVLDSIKAEKERIQMASVPQIPCGALCEILKQRPIVQEKVDSVLAFGTVPNCVCKTSYSSRRFGARIPIVKSFMKRKYNSWTEKESPLYIAVGTGDRELILSLLEAGADPNLMGGETGYPINLALSQRNMDLFDFLLAHGAKGGLTDISYAQDEATIDKLLALGAEPEGIDFGMAIRNQDKKLIRKYLSLGAVPQNVDHFYLIRFCKADLLQLLLDGGMSPEVSNANKEGTLLLEAVQAGEDKMVTMLLEAGANPNIRGTFDKFPLLSAVKQKNEAYVSQLLAHGANPNLKPAKSIFDKNVMETAIQKGNLEILTLLIEKGARVKSENGNNLKFAKTEDARPKVIDLLSHADSSGTKD